MRLQPAPRRPWRVVPRDISGLADHRIGHAGKGRYGKWQRPKAGVQRTGRQPADAATARRFLRKPAGDWQSFRVRRVPQIQSADGAHLGSRGQPAQKTVSLQQHRLCAGPPGRSGRRHAAAPPPTTSTSQEMVGESVEERRSFCLSSHVLAVVPDVFPLRPHLQHHRHFLSPPDR